MEMSTDSTPSPPAKRRRLSDPLWTATAKASSSPFWFDDGDIVLEIEQCMIKIHRRCLQCSPIFSDMLELPQPTVIDSVEGCPLVKLYDSWKDWLPVLKWMYGPDDFMRQPVFFDSIAGALRISTKYEIGALRDWAIDELRSRWPSDLERLGTQSLPHAAEAISLAHECDVPEILPAAFYALSIQKWQCSADGGRSHVVLSPADMRRFIAGREGLQDFLVRILINPLRTIDTANDPYCNPDRSICIRCRPFLERVWREKLSPDAMSPWGCWLLREMGCMAREENNSVMDSVCPDCAFWHHTLIWERIRTLKESIPQLFLL